MLSSRRSSVRWKASTLSESVFVSVQSSLLYVNIGLMYVSRSLSRSLSLSLLFVSMCLYFAKVALASTLRLSISLSVSSSEPRYLQVCQSVFPCLLTTYSSVFALFTVSAFCCSMSGTVFLIAFSCSCVLVM